MTNLKQQALIAMENAIKGPHAGHHAFVLVDGIWLRNRGDEAAAYAEVLAKAERFGS